MDLFSDSVKQRIGGLEDRRRWARHSSGFLSQDPSYGIQDASLGHCKSLIGTLIMDTLSRAAV